MNRNNLLSFFAIALLFIATSCQQGATEEKHIKGALPSWAKNATIYEVNLRQYSNAKNLLQDFTNQLPRLKDMNVDILWFMPMSPISMTNRKATPETMIEEVTDPEEKKKYLGSPYSVSDYRAINPEFGTMDDFKRMLTKAHELGMRVIIDWVPCLLYTSPSPRDATLSRMPSSA